MKKFVYWFVLPLLIAALGVSGYAAWSWLSLDNLTQPKLQVTVGTTAFEPAETEWNVPLFWGLLERGFHWENTQAKANSLSLTTPHLEVTFNDGYDEIIVITKSNIEVFRGNSEDYQGFEFTENGRHLIEVTMVKARVDDSEYGQMVFSIPVNVEIPPPPPPDPKMKVSANAVVQGDTLAIELLNVPDGETPIAETELSLTQFVPMGEGRWLGYTGIADSRDPGKYEIKVRFQDFEETVLVEVTKGDFGRQNLKIDTSKPSISEANSEAAYQQFRDSIRPFYETADSKIYWNGQFLQPVEGRLSSEYGLLRYTNGGTTPRRHAGIDLAVQEGTPIQAPAGGRVVFSDYLLNTGNTLVIEHGGGLKSYYFHLSERAVAVDDHVKAGTMVGKVGTTGYSTGAHLHFELRIGSQNLDPFKFFNGTGGCFMAESEAEPTDKIE